MHAETIYAPASGLAKAGIAIIRLSGPETGAVVSALTGRPLPAPRRAVRRQFVDPVDGSALDDGLLLWFPGPGSYTGEDLAELHIHGGPAVRAAVLVALSRQPGCRLAEPGEFTRRAFLNDRMDLSRAEGVVDLIEAETEAQRRQALRQAEGALFKRCEAWSEQLLRLAAHAEAVIDFPDEDLPEDIWERSAADIRALRDALSREIDSGRRGERLRDGVRVAIVGPPNVGKSSLLNRLAGRDAAIVNARAGTTRDVVEVALDFEGYPVTLSDTAGLRDAVEEIEAEGVRRALRAARAADIVIRMSAPDVSETVPPEALAGEGVVLIDVRNKADMKGDDIAGNRPDIMAGDPAAPPTRAPAGGPLALSVHSGVGWEDFLQRLREAVESVAGLGEAAGLTRARHREAVSESRDALTRALEAPQPDLRAEDIRLALRAIGRITGRVDVEDLLDVVFRDFCIGK
ncbi:tRNA uridine-5-carboxymethylaminomethyl(34) synthesis GTPase MnmE [Marivibrio halodurans]|uniref:tRNA modification GTPase MnmE n=1 Tax=Marivibrio halodurans TaxID=2039722 RepID=A0A8J7V4X1_9PROT|nr:tRNA uridine-5-carboxymethylaminomethyl(34) synthesis GTPase MnmE [Marivibrio halodurans]MBP5858154.1 tRNA uridine-5-carboxymethylaminomethyl(34) synthesis GTPase MnmE [Marivibrio halodurans]